MTASQNKTLLIAIGVIFVIALIVFVLYYAHEKEEAEYERLIAEKENSGKNNSRGGFWGFISSIIAACA
ncbi:MAG: hypothetical protein MJZ72_07195 [Bacteroidales bacterium]|nr:hypothetical protein [Bacteroidales bacterium]